MYSTAKGNTLLFPLLSRSPRFVENERALMPVGRAGSEALEYSGLGTVVFVMFCAMILSFYS